MKLTKYRIRIKPEYKDDLHPDGFSIIQGTNYAVDVEGVLRIYRGTEIIKMYGPMVWAYVEQVEDK